MYDDIIKPGGSGSSEGPLLPTRICDKMWELLLWQCVVATEMGFDSIEDCGFQRGEPMPLDDVVFLVGVENIPRVEERFPGLGGRELFPDGIYKSFAKGWIQIFGAITDFVRQKRIPTENEVHQHIMLKKTSTILSVGRYDPRFHSHFLQKGGKITWAMEALFEHATNMDTLAEIAGLIVEESMKWNDKLQFFKDCVANLESARVAFLGSNKTGVRLNYDSRGCASWPLVESEKTPWGLVYVAEGRWRGRFGYYDDDDMADYEDPASSCAIVYFGAPLEGSYYLIPHRHLRKPPFEGAFTSF